MYEVQQGALRPKGPQFTCFTFYKCNCFTGTKVQTLTQQGAQHVNAFEELAQYVALKVDVLVSERVLEPLKHNVDQLCARALSADAKSDIKVRCLSSFRPHALVA